MMSDSNSDHCQTRKRDRSVSVTKPRVRHRHRRCRKSRKLNAATRLRIRYYELKIRLNDLYERISHSFQRNFALKPGYRRDSMNKASSKRNQTRRSFSKNIKHRRKRYRTKRKSKVLRRVVSKTSLTPIRRNKRQHRNFIDDERSVEFHENRKVQNRKKRSSLTEAKRSISEQKVTTNEKTSRKSLGLGDITTSGGSRKSSLHSFEKRSSKTDENGNETSSPDKDQEKETGSTKFGAEVDEDVKADVELKDTEESNKKYDEIKKIPRVRWPLLQTQQKNNPSVQFSRPHDRIIIPNGIVSDTRRFWKRLGQLTLSQLKLHRRDLDSVPPKYIKFGFGWTPQIKDDKRRLRIRRKKNSNDQYSNSQYTPYSTPYGISSQYLYHGKDVFNKFSSSPPTDFSVLSSSLRRSLHTTPSTTATTSSVPRKTPLTAINRQVSDSSIKFSSLIPQIRKAAADSRSILSKLESSSGIKSTLPVNIRSPTIPDHQTRDNIASSKHVPKIVAGGGGGSLNKTSSMESQSPKYSFNLASLIKYKYANPIATDDAEYKPQPRPNPILDFGKPTSIPTTPAAFSSSRSEILSKPLYKPATEFTAKFHHLLAQN